jgi:hypothetical protein
MWRETRHATRRYVLGMVHIIGETANSVPELPPWPSQEALPRLQACHHRDLLGSGFCLPRMVFCALTESPVI